MCAAPGQYPNGKGICSLSLFSAQNTDVMAGAGAVILDFETEATGRRSDKTGRVWVFRAGKLSNAVLDRFSEDHY